LRVEELATATRDAILARNPIHDALWHGWHDAGFDTAQHASRAGAVSFFANPLPDPPLSGLDPGITGDGAVEAGRGRKARRARFGSPRELGLRDLVRAVMADQFIAPIWRRIGRASRGGDWPRAVRLYHKALRRVPGAPAVWVQYGHALKETGDVVAAELAYRRAVALAPDVAEWHLFLGEALLRQSRIEEARAALLRCEQLDPAALQQKKLELAASGNPAEAISAYWRALTGSAASR
jgi:hypothetical protein